MARASIQTSASTEQRIATKASTGRSLNLKNGIGTSIIGGIVSNGVLTLQDSAGGSISIHGLDSGTHPFGTDAEVIAGNATSKVASIKQLLDNYLTRVEYSGDIRIASGFVNNNDLHLVLTDTSEVVVPNITGVDSYDHFIFNSAGQYVTQQDADDDWANI
jgi:hypothetical protein